MEIDKLFGDKREKIDRRRQFKIQCNSIRDQFDCRIFERDFLLLNYARFYSIRYNGSVNRLHCDWNEATLAPRDW